MNRPLEASPLWGYSFCCFLKPKAALYLPPSPAPRVLDVVVLGVRRRGRPA